VAAVAAGLVLAVSAFAAPPANVLDIRTLGPQPVALVQQFSQWSDPTGNVTAEQVQQPEWRARFGPVDAAQTRALSYGVTSDVVWLRLKLANPSGMDLHRVLEISNAKLSSVQVTVVTPGAATEVMQAGAALPFGDRAVANRFLVFPVKVPAASETTVYLRVQSLNVMAVPARLWEPQAYARYVRDDYIGQAWYFGMAMAMLLFNLLLFAALRDSIYILYVAFSLSVALSIATIGGLGKEFLWPQSIWWADVALAFLNNITAGLLLLFLRRMLNTPVLMPRADKLLWVCALVMLVLPVYSLVDFQGLVYGVLFIQLLVAVVIVGVATWCARTGERSAWTFLLAFSALLVGAVVNILLSFELVPPNFWTNNGIQIGSAVEMVMLALALADRFNLSRRETLRAQADALGAERQLVETLRNSERLLEERVDKRTGELSRAVQRLEQTQAELVQSAKLASLGALVAGVAHELNTPIGNALTVATTMDEATRKIKADIEGAGIRKSTLLQYLENVSPMAELLVRSCEHAAALVSSFKRVAVDQTSEERRRFDVKNLVDDICASLRPGHKHLPWVIQVDIPEGLSCDSYPGPLGQVVSNMIQNAVTHAFEGRAQGTIRISARLVDRSIELTIADDGNGMPPDVLARVFDPFFTTRLGQGGSGLGLSISQNILAGVMGGTLQAFSEPGSGSKFVLSFPQEPQYNTGPDVLESTYAGLS
jgi:signal transduction histidine kinase